MATDFEQLKQKLRNRLGRRLTISFSISHGTLYITAFVLAIAAYAAWEIYWYIKIDLYFIKWHTHIAATALLFSFIPVSAYIFYRLKPTHARVLIVSCSVWVALILIEVLLVLTGGIHTYFESRYGFYRSPFLYDTTNVYNIITNKDSLVDYSPEFSYTYRINSLGFVGNEWSQAKDSTTYRIITIGDSFTQGVGAAPDSSYPALLQNILNARGLKAEVLNAGAGGSDPVFGYKNMQDRLSVYKPDLVIQAVSENDVLNDFGIKGGFERFKNDSTLHSGRQDRLEVVYALSYTARIFLNAAGYNYRRPHCMGNKADCLAEKNVILKEVIARYSALAEANNYKVLLVIYPTKYENRDDTYFFDFSQAKEYLTTQKHVIGYDLMPCYKTVFKNEPGYEGYYWDVDGHHNGDGYRVMAECIANGVSQTAVLPATEGK